MARLDIHLLGPFQVSRDSVLITGFESNKVRALLAYLAVESSQSHHREKLADLLWPELPPGRASSNLNQALYNLRRLVHDQQEQLPYLLRSRETLQFNPQSDYWLDVEALTEELEDASFQDLTRQDLDPAACHGLQTAVELYRGDFLEGLAFDSSLPFDEWVLTVRYRLQRLALRGLHSLVEYYASQKDFARALPYAWRQVELDPLDESACRQLMGLLAASGQRNQALTHFERLQAMLAEELKVPPETETLALRDQIRGEVAATPAEHLLQQHNLPAVLTPLIGRGHELATVQAQLEDPATRLLTLYGPGGSGKSRLALAVAQANLAQFSHGVFFVPLNPLQSPEAILPAILEALDLPRLEHGSHLSQLTHYLQDKHVLLVLDGFEHLLAGVGWLADLLRQAPGLKLLVTSRTRLNLKDEQLYPLAGMCFPSKHAPAEEILACDAVQLLLAGLRRARPGYQSALAEAADLWQICRRVQGMPLGLLLAASWGATLSLAEIASEVCRGLDYLSADWADVPARQRSLRATFDHTWRLLEPRQQAIFQELSVFQGAFTRQAARAVCQASPHELRALVERSLLLSTAPGWYELHELLRQYGRERLAQSTEVEQEICTRHSAFYLERLARFGEALKSAKQPEALASLDREHENIRAAWIWTAEQGEVAQLAPVVEALCLYYDRRVRYAEGESACNLAIEKLRTQQAGAGQDLLEARLLTWQSHFTRLLNRQQLARKRRMGVQSLLEQASSSNLDTRLAQALLSFELGASNFERDLAIARQHYQHSLALFRELEETWWSTRVLLQVTLCDLQMGDFEAAQLALEACLADLSTSGDPGSLAYALERKGYLHVRRGEMDNAMQTMQAALAVYKSIGDQYNLAEGLSAYGRMLCWHGRYLESIDFLTQSLAIYQELGGLQNKAKVIPTIGMVNALLGRYPQARALAAEGLRQGRESNFRRVLASSLLVLGWVECQVGNYHQAVEHLQESVDEYRQLKHQDELGWALATLAHANLHQGRTAEGLVNLRSALQIGIESKADMTVRLALGPSALWASLRGDPARALELYSLACQNPALANSSWFAEIYGVPVSDMAAQLPAEAVTAAQERGRRRDLWETAAELLEALNAAIQPNDPSPGR